MLKAWLLHRAKGDLSKTLPCCLLLLSCGIALMILPVAYCLLLTIPLPIISFTKRAACTFESVIFLLSCCWALNAAAIFLLARATIRSRLLSAIGSIVAALVFPLSSYLALGWYFVRQRLHLALGFLGCSFVMLLLYVFRCLPLCCYSLDYSFLMQLAIYAFMAAAILLAIKEEMPVWQKAVLLAPAMAGIAAMMLLLLQFQRNKESNQILRQEISQMLGTSIMQEDYQKYVESGLEYDKEPLASFMTATMKYSERLQNIKDELIPNLEQDEKNLLIAELHKVNPGYEKVILTFTDAEPQKIAHKHNWTEESAASILLPELSKLRAATRFLALQIYVSPRNKEIVARNNSAMMVLRDWALHGDTTISVLVGIAIEASRIKALCSTLPNIEYTDDEWKQFLAKEPDWNHLAARVYGHELGFYENIKNFVLKYAIVPQKSYEIKALLDVDVKPRLVPLNFITLLFEIDNKFALHYFKREIMLALEEQHNYAEMEKQEDSISNVAHQHGCLLSAMLLPAISSATKKIDSIKDLRRMAILAHKVMEYKRQNGILPESLELISNDLLDSIDHNPFCLKTRDIEMPGFKISAKYNDSPHHLALKNYIMVHLSDAKCP